MYVIAFEIDCPTHRFERGVLSQAITRAQQLMQKGNRQETESGVRWPSGAMR